MSPPPPAVAGIRKAAALACWVPGVSLVVYQSDWPPLLVATSPQRPPDGEVWIPISPYEFRSVVLDTPGGATSRSSRLVGPCLGRGEADVRVQVVADDETTLDDAGLFVSDADRRQRAVGFATLAAVPGPEPVTTADTVPSQPDRPLTWDTDRSPPLMSRVDGELGIRLVSCTYPSADAVRAELAHAAAFDALLAASVDEVTLACAAA
ncbi:MAG: hypothetical protein AAGA93_26280 [Actinomycetota bacterium]